MADASLPIHDRYHHQGGVRTIVESESDLLADRVRWYAEPPSAERSARLCQITKRLQRLAYRSPWRE